jgi:hypothetical protein
MGTVFKPKKEDVTRGLRKLRSKVLHDLRFSPDMIRVIKSEQRNGLGMKPVFEKCAQKLVGEL